MPWRCCRARLLSSPASRDRHPRAPPGTGVSVAQEPDADGRFPAHFLQPAHRVVEPHRPVEVGDEEVGVPETPGTESHHVFGLPDRLLRRTADGRNPAAAPRNPTAAALASHGVVRGARDRISASAMRSNSSSDIAPRYPRYRSL